MYIKIGFLAATHDFSHRAEPKRKRRKAAAYYIEEDYDYDYGYDRIKEEYCSDEEDVSSSSFKDVVSFSPAKRKRGRPKKIKMEQQQSDLVRFKGEDDAAAVKVEPKLEEATVSSSSEEESRGKQRHFDSQVDTQNHRFHYHTLIFNNIKSIVEIVAIFSSNFREMY